MAFQSRTDLLLISLIEISMWAHTCFALLSSLLNVASNRRLHVTALKVTGITRPFSSFLLPVTSTTTWLSSWVRRNVNTRKERSMGVCPASLIPSWMNVLTAYSACSLASFGSSFRHTSLSPSFGDHSFLSQTQTLYRKPTAKWRYRKKIDKRNKCPLQISAPSHLRKLNKRPER